MTPYNHTSQKEEREAALDEARAKGQARRLEAARAAEGDKKERAARKLYNSRGGGGSGGEREGSAAVSAPVEVFVDAN